MTAPEFQKLVTTANRVAFEFNESRCTSVITSFALSDALQRLGYGSRPLRIEAAVTLAARISSALTPKKVRKDARQA